MSSETHHFMKDEGNHIKYFFVIRMHFLKYYTTSKRNCIVYLYSQYLKVIQLFNVCYLTTCIRRERERERERERKREILFFLSSGSRFVMHNFASDTNSANSIRNVQKKRRLI